MDLEELKRIATLNDKIDSLNDTIANLNDKIKKYQHDISDLQKENNSLKESLNQSVQKLTQTEQKLTKTDHELREARDVIANNANLLGWKTQMVEDLHRIIFDEKYDEWVDSQWRFMERTDFEDFLKRLRSVFG